MLVILKRWWWWGGGRTDDHPVSNAGGAGAVPSFTRFRVDRESFPVPLPPRGGLNLFMGGAQAAQRQML